MQRRPPPASLMPDQKTFRPSSFGATRTASIRAVCAITDHRRCFASRSAARRCSPIERAGTLKDPTGRSQGGGPILIKLSASGRPYNRRLADLQPNPFPFEPLPRKASDLNIHTARESSGDRTSLRPRLIFDVSCDSGTGLGPPSCHPNVDTWLRRVAIWVQQQNR